MSDGAQQISDLEAALLARAEKLAAEYLANGQQSRQQILAETSQRLRIEEEREVLAAKAHAERRYQQQVQAAELELRAELDHQRWALVNAVIADLPARLAQLADDEARYLPLLLGWLREGAQAIERERLLVQVNARDLQRLQENWQRYAQQTAPGKQLELSPRAYDCIGGVLVVSHDGNIRFDNTFEGRMEKLGTALEAAIAGQLLPDSEETHG